MNKRDIKRNVFALAGAVQIAVLTACGGGGGGSTVTGPVTANPTPSTPSVSVAGNLLSSVPPPTYAAGSPELAMFNQLNSERAAGGFGMLAQSSALDQAAKNHANFMLLNYIAGGVWNTALIVAVDTATGWLTGHIEAPGKTGFTGVFPIDRATAAGYKAIYVAEVISEGSYFSQTQPFSGCVDRLLSSVFHRGALLTTQLRDFGASVSYMPDGKTYTCVIDPAFTTANAGVAPTGWVGIYPSPGQTNVTKSFANEAPDPLPSSPVKGNPASVFIEPRNTLVVSSFTMTDGQGNKVPAKLLQNVDFPTYIGLNQAYLLPTSGLAGNTVYSMQFSGINNGTPFSRSWSFTTAP